MFVSSNYQLCKLKLIDEQGDNILSLNWTKTYDNRGKWFTRDIPDDKEIIGLYCTTEKYNYSIPFIGFILWSPLAERAYSPLEENSNLPYTAKSHKHFKQSQSLSVSNSKQSRLTEMMDRQDDFSNAEAAASRISKAAHSKSNSEINPRITKVEANEDEDDTSPKENDREKCVLF